MYRCSIRAFTLIELLVTVGIISLLISLLLPSLSQSRRAAKKVVCMGNMQQIGKAVLMYNTDQKGLFPRCMETASTGFPVTMSYWAVSNYQGALKRYLFANRGGVNVAGTGESKASVWFDPSDPDAAIPAMWGSFENNGYMTDVPRRDSQITRPADTIYSTLREKNWPLATGVAVPNPLPVTSPQDPFWSSEFFDMGLDPWSGADTGGSNQNNPNGAYPWQNGRAAPPYSLYPGDPNAVHWDEEIDGRFPRFPQGNQPRYGSGQPYSFCDGHVAFMPFESTYRSTTGNLWSVNKGR